MSNNALQGLFCISRTLLEKQRVWRKTKQPLASNRYFSTMHSLLDVICFDDFYHPIKLCSQTLKYCILLSKCDKLILIKLFYKFTALKTILSKLWIYKIMLFISVKITWNKFLLQSPGSNPIWRISNLQKNKMAVDTRCHFPPLTLCRFKNDNKYRNKREKDSTQKWTLDKLSLYIGGD